MPNRDEKFPRKKRQTLIIREEGLLGIDIQFRFTTQFLSIPVHHCFSFIHFGLLRTSNTGQGSPKTDICQVSNNKTNLQIHTQIERVIIT